MTYPGGKAGPGVYQAIINQMPPHAHYVEAFLGGGAVLLHKRPAPASTIAIERDPAVAAAFPRDAVPNLRIDCTDAIEWLAQRQRWQHSTLLYLDPPYLLSTRVKKKIYPFELCDDDHRRLLSIVRGLPCMVMLSGYRSPLYDHALADWRRVDFQAMTRGGVATESLWCNFAAPVALHDTRYVGDNFRERERIRRLALRWKMRLAAMPPLERQVVLSGLLELPPPTMASTDSGTVTIGEALRREPPLPLSAA